MVMRHYFILASSATTQTHRPPLYSKAGKAIEIQEHRNFKPEDGSKLANT